MRPSRPGSKHLLREINEALVLDCLRLRGPIVRSDIARITGLSGPSITQIVARLMQAGLVTEVHQEPSSGGRPARALALHPGGGGVVGVWLTRGRVEAAVVNLVGDVVDEHSVAWSGSPDVAEDVVAEVVRTLITRSSSPVIGLGVTLSGVVDYETGVVRHSGLLEWDDVPLGTSLADRLSIPVTVDKLVNAMSAALVLFDEGRGSTDMLVVSAGHSLGLSLVLGGRVHHGNAGAAGSLGHTSICLPAAGTRRCHCGAYGCVDTVASEWALLSELNQLGYPDVETAANQAEDDERVREIFTSAGRVLGGAVANVAKIIDPQRVILAGAEARLGPLIEPFRKELHRSLSDAGSHDVDLNVVHTNQTTWARGAACQSLVELFQVSHSQRKGLETGRVMPGAEQ